MNEKEIDTEKEMDKIGVVLLPYRTNESHETQKEQLDRFTFVLLLGGIGLFAIIIIALMLSGGG